MNRETRPKIRRPVARQLRQEAGFGCARCGLPIYQYHHIIPYHEDDPYPIAEMMVLCPLCHDMATKGALPTADQWALKADPYNIQTGRVEGALVLNQDYCAIQVGTCFVAGEGVHFAVDGEELLSLGMARPGRSLLLSATLYDERDNLLAEIVENEWQSGDPFPWDIESDHQRLSIRERAREINLEIDARCDPPTVRATLWRHGAAIVLDPTGVQFGRDRATASGIEYLGLAGLSLTLDTNARTIGVAPDPRLGSGVLVSEADPDERLRKTVAAWERTRTEVERSMSRNDPCWCGSGLKLKRCHLA